MSDQAQVMVGLSNECGGQHTFENVEKFKEWLAREKGKFSWLAEPTVKRTGPNDEQWQAEAPHILATAQRPFQAALELLNTPGVDQARAVLKTIGLLKNADIRGQLLVSGTPRNQFVENLRTQRPVIAMYALSWLIRYQVLLASNNRDAFEGFTEATLFLSGRGEAPVIAGQQALEQLLANLNGRISATQQLLTAAAADLDANQKSMLTLRSTLESEVTRQRVDSETIKSKLDSEAKEVRALLDKDAAAQREILKSQNAAQIQESKSAIEAYEKLYNDALALDAPVKYWSDKTTSHNESAKKWLVAAVISVVGAVVLIACAVGFTWTANYKAEFAAELWMQVIMHLGPTGLASFFGIWAVRFTLRSYLSQKHLADDADLRATMVQSYLALGQRTKVAHGDQGMNIALQALFRPVQIGLLPDEQMPSGPSAVLQGALDATKPQ